MTIAALSFRDVTVRYEVEAEPAVDKVSFTVESGEKVAMVGLNGSGKTTVLLAAAGLLPHQGEISVCGVVSEKKKLREIRSKMGFLFNVPEDQLLFPKVIDDVAFGLRRKGLDASAVKAKALEALRALDVDHLAQAPCHHLSHGQKQRVALAGALVSDPALLLLDEPSAGLDPPGKRSLAEHLRSLGTAMLVATHDLEFARRFCTRCILLNQSRIECTKEDFSEVERLWGIL